MFLSYPFRVPFWDFRSSVFSRPSGLRMHSLYLREKMRITSGVSNFLSCQNEWCIVSV